MEINQNRLYRKTSTVPLLLSTEWILVTIFMLQILNNYLSEMLSLWEIETATTIVYMVIVLLCALAYFKAFVNRPILVIVLLAVIGCVLGTACVFDKEIAQYVFDFGTGSFGDIGKTELFAFAGLCLPVFLLCCLEIDLKVVYRWLYRYSVVAGLMFIALMGLHIFRFAARLNYMSVAYNVIVPFMVLYFASREQKDRWATILWIGIFAGLLAGGCRGALLTVVVLVFLWELRRLMPLDTKKFLGLMLFAVAVVVVLINFWDIISAVDRFFESQGYRSRLLEKFFGKASDGDLFHFSDREKLYNIILKDLTLTGHGAFADRTVLGKQYAHNVIFEILYQYGYLFGIPVLLVFFSFLIRIGRKAMRSGDEFLVFVWAAFGIYFCTKLMFSASYITDRAFWLFFGLCIAINRKRRSENAETDG